MNILDTILDYKIELFGVKIRIIDVLFFSVMMGIGLSIRLRLYDIESGDYDYFLSTWMEECRAAGGFGYLGIEPGLTSKSTINYGCMYQYVFVLLYYLKFLGRDLYLLKSVSVIFDVLCAVTVMRITYHITGGSVEKAVLSFGIVMFLPTVLLNSAAWAQCDSIYSAFVLLSFLHLLKGNNNRIFIYLALAYSFKQQAIFFVPFLLIMWLKGKVKLRYIFWCPIVLLLTMVPALIAGRRFEELMGIYGKQVAYYNRLAMNYPSIYTIVSTSLDTDYRKYLIAAGTLVVVAVFGAMAYYIRNKSFEISGIYMVTLFVFTTLACVFMLPVMHERYGFLPEVLSVSYGVTRFKRITVCFCLQMISIITYSRFLFGTTVENIWPLSIFMFIIIVFVGYDLYRQMSIQEVESA